MPIREVVKRHPLTSTKVHHRAKNKQFLTLRCTKTGSAQPKLSAACFVVQSCLADADFVVFSNYCLIGTRQTAFCFLLFRREYFWYNPCAVFYRQRCGGFGDVCREPPGLPELYGAGGPLMSQSQEFTMQPVARIRSEFAEKFGVPRQSG